MKLIICASAKLFPRLAKLSQEIETLGIEVALPQIKDNQAIIDWSQSPDGYAEKTRLIREHLAKIAQSDALLVANYPKDGAAGYIGPSVLLEMGVGFYLQKPIYVLHDSPADSPLFDEIMALEPVFLKGETTKLRAHLV